MKIKTDFVSNSSSASFILYVESDNNLEDFKSDMVQLVNLFTKSEGWLLEDRGPIIAEQTVNIINNTDQVSSRVFKLEFFTCMFNSILTDVPSFVQWLVFENMTTGLREYGIKNITLRIGD